MFLISSVFVKSCTGGQESLTDSQATIAMDSCGQMLATRYDDKLGGFGNAPKFPRPSELNLLLVQHLRAKAAGSRVEAGELLIPSPLPWLALSCITGNCQATFVDGSSLQKMGSGVLASACAYAVSLAPPAMQHVETSASFSSSISSPHSPPSLPSSPPSPFSSLRVNPLSTHSFCDSCEAG